MFHLYTLMGPALIMCLEERSGEPLVVLSLTARSLPIDRVATAGLTHRWHQHSDWTWPWQPYVNRIWLIASQHYLSPPLGCSDERRRREHWICPQRLRLKCQKVHFIFTKESINVRKLQSAITQPCWYWWGWCLWSSPNGWLDQHDKHVVLCSHISLSRGRRSGVNLIQSVSRAASPMDDCFLWFPRWTGVLLSHTHI